MGDLSVGDAISSKGYLMSKPETFMWLGKRLKKLDCELRVSAPKEPSTLWSVAVYGKRGLFVMEHGLDIVEATQKALDSASRIRAMQRTLDDTKEGGSDG